MNEPYVTCDQCGQRVDACRVVFEGERLYLRCCACDGRVPGEAWRFEVHDRHVRFYREEGSYRIVVERQDVKWSFTVWFLDTCLGGRRISEVGFDKALLMADQELERWRKFHDVLREAYQNLGNQIQEDPRFIQRIMDGLDFGKKNEEV